MPFDLAVGEWLTGPIYQRDMESQRNLVTTLAQSDLATTSYTISTPMRIKNEQIEDRSETDLAKKPLQGEHR